MKIKLTIIIAIIFIGSLSVARNSTGFTIPIGVRHFIHLIFPPTDLYEPIVNDNYLFWEEGFSRDYLLKPKYLDFYEIGIHSPTDHLPASFRFQGKIKAQFYSKSKLLFEKEIDTQIAGVYIDGDMEHYKKISLFTFEMPFLDKYKDDVRIKLTVLKPDMNLEKYANSVKIYIAVSGIP